MLKNFLFSFLYPTLLYVTIIIISFFHDIGVWNITVYYKPATTVEVVSFILYHMPFQLYFWIVVVYCYGKLIFSTYWLTFLFCVCASLVGGVSASIVHFYFQALIYNDCSANKYLNTRSN